MTADEEDALDAIEVPQMALKALDEAHRRAVASGRPVIVAIGGQLIEIQGDRRTLIKEIPLPHKVDCRSKRAKS